MKINGWRLGLAIINLTFVFTDLLNETFDWLSFLNSIAFLLMMNITFENEPEKKVKK